MDKFRLRRWDSHYPWHQYSPGLQGCNSLRAKSAEIITRCRAIAAAFRPSIDSEYLSVEILRNRSWGCALDAHKKQGGRIACK